MGSARALSLEEEDVVMTVLPFSVLLSSLLLLHLGGSCSAHDKKIPSKDFVFESCRKHVLSCGIPLGKKKVDFSEISFFFVAGPASRVFYRANVKF